MTSGIYREVGSKVVSQSVGRKEGSLKGWGRYV